MASHLLEDSSEAGSDAFSEPVTVSCGLLLTLLGRGSCNSVGRTVGQRWQHLPRRFSSELSRPGVRKLLAAPQV